MANYLALQLDRAGEAQMSCIAGVGGDVRPLVQTAKNSEFIITLDGCALKCCQACLGKHHIQSNLPIVLSDYQVEKKLHQDFSMEKAHQLLEEIRSHLKDPLNRRNGIEK